MRRATHRLTVYQITCESCGEIGIHASRTGAEGRAERRCALPAAHAPGRPALTLVRGGRDGSWRDETG